MLSGVSARSRLQSGSTLNIRQDFGHVSPSKRGAWSASRRAHIQTPRCPRCVRSLPLACSGDMYAAVPRIMPGLSPPSAFRRFERLTFVPSVSNAFASPKSSTFTLPSGVIFTLAGFRSR